MKTILAASIAVLLAAAANAAPAPGGAATDISNADVQAMAKRLSSQPGGDELLRVVPINNGEYNVAVAVVHRAKAAKLDATLEHSQIAEVYHIISGSGTMVSDGGIENAKPSTDPHTLSVVGPSSGGKIAGGHTRKISAGDVVIVPPNTAHGWSEVTEELVYLVVRMDPKKVLKPN